MTRSARYHARRRQRLFDRLGNTCNSCGFDSLFTGPLQIDHRKGGGNENRRLRGTAGEITYLLSLPDSILHEFVQPLCEPCHEAKTFSRV